MLKPCYEDEKTSNDWKKILVNHIHNRAPLPRIYNELSNSTVKKPNLMRKWSKDMKGHFTQEDIQRANKRMKRCSTLLAIRVIQIEITIRYHYIPIRMAKLKRNDDIKC